MTDIVVRVIDCHVVYLKDYSPKFLMLKRSANKLYAGTWQCITGKIENNEKPIKTAIRELKEETGLKAINQWAIDIVNNFYEPNYDRMNLIPVFGVEVESLSINLSDEHCDYKWCSINEALELFTWNQQKKGLQEFYNMLLTSKKKLSLTKINLN